MKAILFVLFTFLTLMTAAESVALAPEQAINLNIKTAQPQTADRFPLGRLSATVLLPPDQSSVVAASFDGVVKQLMVSAHQEVRAGETLALLESRELVDIQTDMIDAAMRLKLQKNNYDRALSLNKEGLISQKEFFDAELEYRQAQTRLATLKTKLHILGMQPESIDAVLANGKPQGLFTLTAPVSGSIIQCNAVVGERFDVGKSLMIISGLGELWLEIPVSLAQAEAIADKQLYLDDRPVKIVALSRVVDPLTQTRMLRISAGGCG